MNETQRAAHAARARIDQLFKELQNLTKMRAIVDFNDEIGHFGIYVDDIEYELIGSGGTVQEALQDAIATAKKWTGA